ncbi:hypothetical protein ACFVFJ_27135 [Streptomyces sp. NPDC057717]|uniref:hypothetical protein n=1 Tax=Streptomyces sp. NPDC057717 TaxID=3346224 RepID=UPI0036862B43
MLLPEPCAHDPAAPRRLCVPYRLRRPGRLDYEGKVALLVLVDLGIDPGAPWSILLAAAGEAALRCVSTVMSHTASVGPYPSET